MLKRSMIARRGAPVIAAALAGMLTPLAADAAITFTFQDPSSDREFQYTEGDAQNDGMISYSLPQDGTFVSLTVDASDHGLAPINYQATLNINLTVGQASDLGFGAIADVSGTFEFIDAGRGDNSLILQGVITDGNFFVVGSTGAQVSSSTEESLVLSAGPVLQDYLNQGGLSLTEQMDSSFSLSSIRLDGGAVGVPGINEFGYLESFSSNAAYVGSADIIPSPPATVTLAALTAVTTRRRRRAA